MSQKDRQMAGTDMDAADAWEPSGQPMRWYCDTDCRASNRLCRGESGKDPTAKNLCPYYEDMLF